MNRNQDWNLKLAGILAATVILATGCGNLGANRVHRAPSGSYGNKVVAEQAEFTDDGDSQVTAEGYKCPLQPNVVPDWDQEFDGSGLYSVCSNATKQSELIIHGSTARSNEICVFPAEFIDEDHVYVKPNAKDSLGRPIVKCVVATSDGIRLSFAEFGLINYNSVFIVEKPDKTAMSNCLMGGNYFACPANGYSFGKFR